VVSVLQKNTFNEIIFYLRHVKPLHYFVMNKRYFFFCFAFVAICVTLFSACKKEDDYRDKWVGEWEFTTYDYRAYGIIEEPLTIETDTIHFIGTVEIHDKERLKIVFKPNATEPFPIINGLIYPVVDNSGTLSYPEYSPSLAGYLYGEFNGSISENTIHINYYHYIGANGPLGARDNANYTIQGIKIIK